MANQTKYSLSNRRRAWLRAAAIAVVLLLAIHLSNSLALRVTDAAPPAQIHDDVCRVLPKDPGLGKLSTGAISGNCVGEYDFTYPGGRHVFQFIIAGDSNVADAKTDLGYHKSWHPTVGGGSLGDEGIEGFEEITNGDLKFNELVIVYRRGTCVVNLSGTVRSTDAVLVAQARKIAAAIDGGISKVCQPYVFSSSSAPPPDIDLSIDHVQVTQAIQNAENGVPLVADRTTLVRVFIKVTGAPKGPIKDVTIDACGMGSSFRGMTDKCVPAANKNTPFTAPLNPQRANITDTLNLFLPNAMTYANTGPAQGVTYPLELWINPNKTISETNYSNNRYSLQLTFTPQKRLRVGYLRVGYQPPGQAAPTFPSANVSTYAQLTQKLYPLPDNGIDYNEIPVRRPYRKPLFDPTDPLTKTFALEDQFAATLRKAYDLFTGDKPDQLVAWLPTIPNPIPPGVGITTGQSDPMWFTYGDKTKGTGHITFVKDFAPRDALFRQAVLAHEMAHNLGLHHTNQGDACGAWDSDSLWPHKNSQIQEFGFDTLTRSIVPNTRFDVMSYCMNPSSNIWISPFSFTQLYNSYLNPRADTSRQVALLARDRSLHLQDMLAQPRQEQLIISGAIRRDGTVGRLDPAYHSADLDPGDALPSTGNQCIRLGGATSTLATYCFTLPFRAHQSNVVLDEQYFTLKVPYPAGTTRVSLVRDNRELATLTASPNPPTLAVTSPRAGETWTGAQTLTWNSVDADGGKMTYTVLYTPNGGKSWYPLDVDMTDTQLAIQTLEIANGDQVQFRVLASDGLNTTRADSPPIQVRNGIAPEPTASASGNNTAAPPDSTLLLAAGLGVGLCGVFGILGIALLIAITRPRNKSSKRKPMPRPADLPERSLRSKPTDLPK
ncbi:MAG: hypothetical protein HZB51_33105 [Chloroflexi bacterium]|nr:hypothetical protein [Chloroflexota bacterium]